MFPTRLKTILAFSILSLGALSAAHVATAATDGGKHLIGLAVQVTSSGKMVGTFRIKPAETVPTRAGETYELSLVGTAIEDGKATTIPVNATFTRAAGAGRITLSDPGASSVDVKVDHRGPQGNLVKYTVASGYDIRPGLATGYILLR